MPTSRRAFLTGSVVYGCAALAAACSPSATAAPTVPPPAAASTVASTATNPTVAPTALSAAAKPTTAPAVTKPVAIKAAWVAKTANQMLWPLAKDAGYFDKYGIAFDLNYINGSSVAVPALFAKDLDVASVAGSAIVGAQASGQDMIMVAGFLNQAVFRVMATDLQSIDEVKGKTV
ncbi:MAG TPA: ABC transporter substrate-binding protein, partial [Chloroflexota bacterium]|nr:ABC transporter substrate-binding protein [Chloroflexota bacterium]